MTSWSIDPVGGPWFTFVVACVLAATLLIGPSKRRLTIRQRAVLVGLRAATALLLLFAMLRPTLVATEIRKLPGSLVLMVDSSRSMQITDSVGGASRWKALKSTLQSASDQLLDLAEAWDIKTYLFDDSVDLTQSSEGQITLPEQADGPQTAIGSAMDDVLSREAQQRVVAILLLSDGAQRSYAPRDLPPQTVAQRLAVDSIPLYTFAFGKPALGLQSDLRIESLLANDIVFSETPVTIRAEVAADGYINQTYKAQLLWETPDGEMEVVDTQQVDIGNDGRRIPVSFTYTPLIPGEFKVSVQIESPTGELATNNNSQSTFVSVMKGGINVLYLAGSTSIGGGPGIEPRFVRSALAAHADIHVRYDLLNYRKKEIDIRQQLRDGKYDVYLVGDVDVMALDAPSWQMIADQVEQGAGLAMLGGFHSFGPGGFRDSPLAGALPIIMGRAERQNFGERPREDMHLLQPLKFVPEQTGEQVHPILELNTEGDATLDWASLPPLDGANRLDRTQLKPNAQVIACSDDARRWPLLVTGAWGSGRTAALAVDSTWRWQMEGHGDIQRRFWRQLVLWLARKDDTDGQAVWVRLDGRRYQRGSRVDFSFGAVSDNNQPLSSAVYDIEVQKPDGSAVPLRASNQADKSLASFVETDLAGEYRVTVHASNENQLLGTAQARFLVPDQDMELDQPAAEPTLLAALANLTSEAGGQGLAPEELPELLEQLKSRTAEFEEEISRHRRLWDTWPLFLSFVAILGSEWFLRKRWGLV
ncbi:MAG: hypothetical protein KDA57_01140 [Planctomycetales bacterium]|nr:hypothetical protein [Planctomycetales bacterium]